jgi:hypothetical protein
VQLVGFADAVLASVDGNGFAAVPYPAWWDAVEGVTRVSSKTAAKPIFHKRDRRSGAVKYDDKRFQAKATALPPSAAAIIKHVGDRAGLSAKRGVILGSVAHGPAQESHTDYKRCKETQGFVAAIVSLMPGTKFVFAPESHKGITPGHKYTSDTMAQLVMPAGCILVRVACSQVTDSVHC